MNDLTTHYGTFLSESRDQISAWKMFLVLRRIYTTVSLIVLKHPEMMQVEGEYPGFYMSKFSGYILYLYFSCDDHIIKQLYE